MKRNLYLLLSLCGVLLFCNDVFAQTTVTGANVTKFEATSAQSQPSMFTIPVVGELEVVPGAARFYELKDALVVLPEAQEGRGLSSIGQQDRYAETVRSFLSSRIEELKAEALFKFCEEKGADVILSPTYSVVTTKSEGLKLYLTVKVKGIPARYVNCRAMTANDRALVEINRLLVNTNTKDVKVLTSTESEQTVREEIVRQK